MRHWTHLLCGNVGNFVADCHSGHCGVTGEMVIYSGEHHCLLLVAGLEMQLQINKCKP